MTLSKNTYYVILYSALSALALAWSVQTSLATSFTYEMFIVEFTDGIKLTILINFIIMCFLTSTILILRLLFGELRVIESEHLFETVPMFGINQLFNLAWNDNNFLISSFLPGLIISLKAIHIVLVDRLDFKIMRLTSDTENQSYSKSNLLMEIVSNVHIWVSLFLIVADFMIAKLLIFDVFPGISSIICLMFGFQFAIQAVDALTHSMKLGINIYDLVMYKSDDSENEFLDDFDEDGRLWERKPYFTRSVEIISALLKATAYLGFIYLLTFHSGISLPISMFQGTYSSLRQVYTEWTQLVSFVEASRRLESQLPNATKEDLENSDSLCIICREDMPSIEEYESEHHKKIPSRKAPKRLKCNHILHMGCLKDWLERSENCPICRRKVFGNDESTIPSTSAPEQRIANTQRADVPQDFQDAPTPTATRSSDSGDQGIGFTNSSTENEYQTISLPRSAILPPGWTILPLQRLDQNKYTIEFSTAHRGTLIMKDRDVSREIRLVRPSNQLESQEMNYEGNTNNGLRP